MEQYRGTTIVSVRRNGKVCIGGDGLVCLGITVMKGIALEAHQGHLTRAAVELAKDWRTDRMLRRLEALLAVADSEASLIITGNGDVIEPEDELIAIGSGGPYAQAAARAMLQNTDLEARDIVEKSLEIAADICIYTNHNRTLEEL